MNDPKIIVALDKPTDTEIFNITTQLSPALCKVKIGLEAFVHYGPRIVNEVHNGEGYDVFLDLKLTDIPRTVRAAGEQIFQTMDIWGMTVFALCGTISMEAISSFFMSETISSELEKDTMLIPPKLFAVTVLTSLDDGDMIDLGFKDDAGDTAFRLAANAYSCGFNGVVCSALDARRIKERMPRFTTICPGIRPIGAHAKDQARAATPLYAIRNGADYLVIGRPITEAKDPYAVLADITEEIS